MQVNVVRVQVVRDVATFPSPTFEGLQLELGLRHVRIKVGKVAERPHPLPGICVDTCGSEASGPVEALVDLDHQETVVLGGQSSELAVVGQGLDWRLGEEHVQATAQRSQG